MVTGIASYAAIALTRLPFFLSDLVRITKSTSKPKIVRNVISRSTEEPLVFKVLILSTLTCAL